MSEESITDSASCNVNDQLQQPVAIACDELSGAKKEEKQVTRHFRVGWHADIIFDDQSKHQGYISEISVIGANFFLDSSISEKAMLFIHVPPLDLIIEPHIIAVYGKAVYVVYDGDQQLYRVAFIFLKFHQESDLAYLGERLIKYEREIQVAEP